MPIFEFIVNLSSLIGLALSLWLLLLNWNIKKKLAEIQSGQILRKHVERHIDEFKLCQDLILEIKDGKITTELRCRIEQEANGILEYKPKKGVKNNLVKLKECAQNNNIKGALGCINNIIPWLKNIKDRKESYL